MNYEVKKIIDNIIGDLKGNKIPDSIIKELHVFIAKASIPAFEDLDDYDYYQDFKIEGNTITTKVEASYPVLDRPPYEIFKITKDSDNKEINIEFSSERERYHGAGVWSEEWKSLETSIKREDKFNVKLKETETGYELTYKTDVIFSNARNYLLERVYNSEETDCYDKDGIQLSENSMEIDFDVQHPWGATGIKYVSMHNVKRLSYDLLEVKGVLDTIDENKGESLDLDELRDRLEKAEPSIVMLYSKNRDLASFKHCRRARRVPDFGLKVYQIPEESTKGKAFVKTTNNK